MLKNTNPSQKEVRIEYVTKNDFKSLAKRMGIMDDFKVSNATLTALNFFAWEGKF